MAGFDAEQTAYLDNKFTGIDRKFVEHDRRREASISKVHGRLNQVEKDVQKLVGADNVRYDATKRIGDELKGVGKALLEHMQQNGGAHKIVENVKSGIKDHKEKDHSFKAFQDIVIRLSKFLLAIAVIGTALYAVINALN